jgi:hypothetical protein
VLEIKRGVEEHMEGEEEFQGAWDDVKGGYLRMEDVMAGRAEEVNYMVGRRIWSEVSEEECWRVTGKGPVSVRWVDTNKGTEEAPDVRCRLVGRDFKGGDSDRDHLFAGTPPLEAIRMIFSRAVSYKRGRAHNRRLLVMDAKKAHLNPVCEDDVYIQLPSEAGAGPGICGKLNFWLYGFRKAAPAWEVCIRQNWRKLDLNGGTRVGLCFIIQEGICL